MNPKDKVINALSDVVKKFYYFGPIIRHLKIIEDDKIGTAGVGLHEPILKYSPEFIDSISYDDTIFIMIHEILHIAYKHTDRWDKNYSQKINNIAADLEINCIIRDRMGISAPNSGCFPEDYNLPIFKSMEWYLENLPDIEMKVPMYDLPDPSNENNVDSDEESEFPKSSKFDEAARKVINELKDWDCKEVHSTHTKVKTECKKYDYNKVKEYDLYRFLKKILKSNKEFKNKSYSYRKLSRRDSSDFVLPGMTLIDHDFNFNLYLVVDISGSMYPLYDKIYSSLLKFKKDIKNIRHNVEVIFCDTEVRKSVSIDKLVKSDFLMGGENNLHKAYEYIINSGDRCDNIVFISDGIDETFNYWDKSHKLTYLLLTTSDHLSKFWDPFQLIKKGLDSKKLVPYRLK